MSKHRKQHRPRSYIAFVAIIVCKGGAMKDHRSFRAKDAGKIRRQERRDNGF